MKKRIDEIVISNAQLLRGSFMNFSGAQTKYNREGDRNFCVVIDDPEQASLYVDEGWNIRVLAPREEGDKPIHYLPVKVSYDNFPPKVWLHTRKNDIQLDEESVGQIDTAEIKDIHLVIRPYCWEVNGKTGIKAYLKIMHATLEEDPFAHLYEPVNTDDIFRD